VCAPPGKLNLVTENAIDINIGGLLSIVLGCILY